MPVLTAAVVLIGLLGLVNLLFSFGVVRRLRGHTDILNRLRNRPAGEPVAVMLEAGTTVGEFVARTADGDRVAHDDLAGTFLVGVFSPGCSACEAQLDPFVQTAATHPGGRDHTLVVVVGSPVESAHYLERLAASARVVLESRDGPVSKALGVHGFPAFALVDDGVVRASGFEVAGLPTAIPG